MLRRMGLLALVPLKVLLFAALPPLSAADRAQAAQVVLVGTIENVDEREVDVSGGTDLVYVAKVKVTRREKALLVTKKRPKDTETVRYRRVSIRPPGWTGPVGQSSMPPLRQPLRLFCRYDEKGALVLLEPNGWEAVH
jgi:hypothetical protein